MKEKNFLFETLLAAAVGVALLVCMLLRTFSPAIVLPKLDIPNMALLILAALLGDHYLAKGGKRCYVCVGVLSALVFGLLPVMAGLAVWADALMLGLIGGIAAVALVWLFTWAQDRLATGPAAKAAPILTALGLYLAVQCFAGILL